MEMNGLVNALLDALIDGHTYDWIDGYMAGWINSIGIACSLVVLLCLLALLSKSYANNNSNISNKIHIGGILCDCCCCWCCCRALHSLQQQLLLLLLLLQSHANWFACFSVDVFDMASMSATPQSQSQSQSQTQTQTILIPIPIPVPHSPFPLPFSIPIPYPGAWSSLVLDWCCFTLVFSPCSTYTTLFHCFSVDSLTHSLSAYANMQLVSQLCHGAACLLPSNMTFQLSATAPSILYILRQHRKLAVQQSCPPINTNVASGGGVLCRSRCEATWMHLQNETTIMICFFLYYNMGTYNS